MRIGWIGTGLMGSRMVVHLQQAGHVVTLYARNPASVADLVAAGATLAPTPAAVAAASEVVFTIVGMPADVEAIYLGADGLVGGAQPGTILVDMTTSSPELARRIAAAGAERGVAVLDAPVSGGPRGAETASLSIMVGGPPETLEAVRRLLETLGTTIIHHGVAGAGQNAKIANQIAVGGGMIGICEAFLYTRANGLNPETVLETLGAGIAGSDLMRYMWPRLAVGDMEPGFRVEHMIKDLGLALEAGHEVLIALPGTALVKELYQAVQAAGGAGKGTQALILGLDGSADRRSTGVTASAGGVATAPIRVATTDLTVGAANLSAARNHLIARRADFPALEGLAWFQNGGVSLTPRPVAEAHAALMEDLFLRGPVHITYPADEYSRRDASRARIARFLGADTAEIAIVRGVSEAFQVVLRGIAWEAGDEIVITADEEAALLVPALHVAERHGVLVRKIPLPPDATAAGLLAATDGLLTRRTRLVAFSHVDTDWGIRLPAREICTLAAARGIPTFIDLAQSAGLGPIDVAWLGCDFAGVVSYKWLFGPYAAGALYVRRDRIATLPATYAGGRSEARLDRATDTLVLHDSARRYEYGPWSWPLIHAWAVALDYVESVGLEQIATRTAELTTRLGTGLRAIPGVTPLTPVDPAMTAALVAFTVDGWAGSVLERTLRERWQIVVRSLLNVTDGIRASVAFFTLDEEVDLLLAAIRTLAAEVPRGMKTRSNSAAATTAARPR
jgi:3-hydroxyisobutyrate dehydrogenase